MLVTMLILNANMALAETPLQRIAFGSCAMQFKSQQIFLDFFDEPNDSNRRLSRGIYDARIIGPVGKRVQVILLDTRYFKGPFIMDARSKEAKAAAGNIGSMANYIPNASPEVTLLGEAQ